ncbi:DUF2931 family protein [Vibrio anguillarum]|uniref:DUF2931 family protein n=2 Tax=Vibrio anguillarum TaxID=55601 RepID=UPI0002DE25EB|nr:DUF2931 family protein [Vibrio anguillarum]AQM21258.1 nitroreductase [Vibrio anguillarum]AUB86377.1 DUF2931 domain-containing protein [Vibrio anguillarum]AUB89815.1 DUF2931 domain-containing protein [Vibrio anguillarum]AUB93257.1 DUF2931 domain-containing protein [Vibrio anguillarum]AUB96688.1 DUF2931 domain-containing protein [Vibrio anguillarum]
MNIKAILIILSLCLLSSCASNANNAKYVPRDKWRVGVVMPSFYPVKVTQAYGVNENENWTSLLHSFTPQSFSNSELSNARKKLPNYDGFGLPLHAISITSRYQIGGTNHLPDSVYLYWVSLVNTQFYVTKYIVPESIKQLMAKQDSYTRANGFVVNPCYRTDFVFGLLPNGQAKVWLRGCGETVYLAELAPDKVMDRDSNGFTADTYKEASYLGRIHQRAKDAGVSIDPIPWDKVDKVYSMEEIKYLN